MKAQKKSSEKVQVRNTARYGRGVFARRKIRRGEVVAVFDGPIYDDEFPHWTRDMLKYTIQIGPTLWRDSTGPARYMNHSCDPNCGIRGLNKVVAMREIQKGEELTWDYEMTERSTWLKMKCRCGSAICRKVIGSFDRLPAERRRAYGRFVSLWLRREEQMARRFKR